MSSSPRRSKTPYKGGESRTARAEYLAAQVAREEARAKGLKKYQGVPCRKCGGCWRYANHPIRGGCVDCAARANEYTPKRAEMFRQIYRRDKVKILARCAAYRARKKEEEGK